MGQEDPYNCCTEYETDDDDDIKKVNHNLKGEFLYSSMVTEIR